LGQKTLSGGWVWDEKHWSKGGGAIDNRLIQVAKGDLPADLLLANAQVINVFTGRIEPGNVAICGDRIAGVGDYRKAKEVVDVGGRYIAPGLINGHIHPESSMAPPAWSPTSTR
jgi:adenine deaminase